MNKVFIEGKSNQMLGNAKTWWGLFIDDELDQVAGKYDVFAGLVHEKVGTHTSAWMRKSIYAWRRMWPD